MAVANSARIGNIDGYRFIGCLEGSRRNGQSPNPVSKPLRRRRSKFIVVLLPAHWSKPGKPARISAEKSGALSAA